LSKHGCIVSKKKELLLSLGFCLFLFLFFVQGVYSAPIPPHSLGLVSNETATTPSAVALNISGGRIATINITSDTQNPRWKAFVGNVTGSFALDDAAGSTIYGWSLTTITGEIYATSNSSSISWTTGNVNCSNITTLQTENVKLNHTNPADNVTRTFNNGTNGTHASFVVGSFTIVANSCPTLNTYVSSASQDTSFEEVALYDLVGGNVIYTTTLENNVVGFDGGRYDFQMIVPEVGSPGTTISTAYYLYVEIT
jgi:hypothetical protein